MQHLFGFPEEEIMHQRSVAHYGLRPNTSLDLVEVV
jgi:hypothetical protein